MIQNALTGEPKAQPKPLGEQKSDGAALAAPLPDKLAPQGAQAGVWARRTTPWPKPALPTEAAG